MQMNREQRRALKKSKRPRPGAGHIQLPVNIRFAAEHDTRLMLVPLQCADRLLAGTADESDWHTTIMRLNWARLLNKANFNEGESLIEQAQDAMRAITLPRRLRRLPMRPFATLRHKASIAAQN